MSNFRRDFSRIASTRTPREILIEIAHVYLIPTGKESKLTRVSEASIEIRSKCHHIIWRMWNVAEYCKYQLVVWSQDFVPGTYVEPQIKTFEISHEMIDEKELMKCLCYFGLLANSLEPEMQSRHDYAGSAPSAQLGQKTTKAMRMEPQESTGNNLPAAMTRETQVKAFERSDVMID
jgi:hypothetical protein